MLLKTGVKFKDKASAIAFGAMVVNSIFVKHGYEFVVTSFNDGKHMDGSLHYSGQAWDFRSKHLPSELKGTLLSEIKAALGEDFDVLIEGENTPQEHYHCEWQPK